MMMNPMSMIGQVTEMVGSVVGSGQLDELMNSGQLDELMNSGSSQQSFQITMNDDGEMEMCSEFEERCFPDEMNPDSNCGSVWVGGCTYSSENAPCMSYYQCSEDSEDICYQSCNKLQYVSDCGHYRLSSETGEWEYEHEYCELPYGECSEFKWDPVFEANVFVPGSCPTKCGEFYYDEAQSLCWEPCNAVIHGDCGHYVVTQDDEGEQVWTYNIKECEDHQECVPHTYDAQYDIWVYTKGMCPASEEPSEVELVGE